MTDTVVNHMDIINRITDVGRCEAVADGMFVLTPCEVDPKSGVELEGRQIPERVLISLGTQERLMSIHNKYMDMLNNIDGLADKSGAAIIRGVAWARSDAEQKCLNKAMLKMESSKRKLEFLNIGDDDFKNEDVLRLSVVQNYLKCVDEFSSLKETVDEAVYDRLNNLTQIYVQNRYMAEVFACVTEERDISGKLIHAFDVNSIIEDPYWASQADLIVDVFQSVITYLLIEVQLTLKKTQNTMELCQEIAAEFATELTNSKTTSTQQPKSASQSSETTTQGEYGVLESITPDEK